VFVPLTVWLTWRGSWRSAVVVLAAIIAAATVPVHAFVLRSRPEDVGLAPDGAPPVAPDGAPTALPRVEGPSPKRGLDWTLALTFAVSTLAAAAVADLPRS
jgi:hypothetical protein